MITLSSMSTPTHTGVQHLSRLDISQCIYAFFSSKEQTDQRLKTGPAEIYTPARIASIVGVNVMWIAFA